jgi:hypothetical protein
LTEGPKSTASLAITIMYIFMRIGAKKVLVQWVLSYRLAL